MAFQPDKFNITYNDRDSGFSCAMYTPSRGGTGQPTRQTLLSTKGTDVNDVQTDNYFPADVVPEQGLRVTVIAATSGSDGTAVVGEGMVVRKGAHGGTGDDTSWTTLVNPQTVDVT